MPPTPPRSHGSRESTSPSPMFAPAPPAPTVSHVHVQASAEPASPASPSSPASPISPLHSKNKRPPSLNMRPPAPTISQPAVATSSVTQRGFAPSPATATASTSGAAAALSMPRSQSASDRLSGMLAERPRSSRSSVRSVKSTKSAKATEVPTRSSICTDASPSIISASSTRRSSASDASPAPHAPHAHGPPLPAPHHDRAQATSKPDVDRTSLSPTTPKKRMSPDAASPLSGPLMTHRAASPATHRESSDKPWLPTGVTDSAEIELNDVDASPAPAPAPAPARASAPVSNYAPPYAPRRASLQPSGKGEPQRYALTFAASLSSGADLPLSRRRIELELLWDLAPAPSAWDYLPGAKYLPAWRLRAAGAQSGTARDEGWLRWAAAHVPVVGGVVREWL
ncbi:hypothetical protein CC85DRAFT_288622 [Cutaneotrichosporon oleaginosum]|uniref:Uncharacterized protein n=1 Tax=Cutaneotrichosporon oleaginosum TaxID=879819 RepID=A0A0J0XE62_9TREE|nr:uncharacterized protein CC85DRAFT_288622 [Cutaneotrichosporon oleaginosum]KLT39367.1 hypothetical protein CC85DRAFT_288622 [Cutaneotrichosporon oleaginosum]TXT12087.1 hypothetical protein COLE_02497 [Cutaneotrichosporon oleaginosum]